VPQSTDALRMRGLNTRSPGWQDPLSAMRYWLWVIGAGCLLSCAS